jgi:hypothetical protein
MAEPARRPAIFFVWSAGTCIAAYCTLGFIFGAWPHMFHPGALALFLGAMLLPAMAGTAYLLLDRQYPSGLRLAAVLAAAAAFPVTGFYLWLLTLDPLSTSYVGLLLHPMAVGGIITAFVAVLVWPNIS